VKWLARIAIAAVVLLAVAVGALALLLPRLVRSDAVRDQIQAASRKALGAELRYAELDVGLLPPSLLVREPALAGAGPGASDVVDARQVALRVELLPLLARSLVIDSLVVEGATLRLVRTAQGIQLPLVPPPRAPAEAGAEPKASEGGGAGFALALRTLELRDATLFLEDRTVQPAVTWELRKTDVRARGKALDAPIDVEASFQLASGGDVSASGTASVAGPLDLDVKLDGVALAPLRPYLGRGAQVEGRLGGAVRILGDVANPSTVAKLSLSGARFDVQDVSVHGDVSLDADLKGLRQEPSGHFDIDASGAELRYGEAFTKPPGTKARLSGRLVAGPGGALGVDDVQLSIRNLQSRVQGTLAPKLRLRIDTQPVDLAGWEALVPALAGAPMRGSVRAEALSLSTEPRALDGTIHLDGVVVRPPDLPEMTLDGDLVARGSQIASRDVVAVVAGQKASLDLQLRDLFGKPSYQTRLGMTGADSNALVSAFAQRKDVLLGPLGLSGELRGGLGDGSPLQQLSGNLDFDVVPGRLVGVSLLREALQQVGGVGGLAAEIAPLVGGRDLRRYYDDHFESLKGVVHIDRGVANQQIALVYSGYGANLKGEVRLADLALDLTGEIVLSPELDATIARGIGAPRDYQGQRRVIPLAAVGGTLAEPKVQVAQSTAREFVGAYARAIAGEQLRRSLGRDGQRILDALGGRRPSQ
jgi:Domain of Unknown Function (DUF748)/AsmA-like C-terminal region